MRPLSAAALALAVVAAGCVDESAQPLSETALAAEVQAIEALDEALSEAAMARDAARFASFFADDAVQLPPGAPPLEGRAAIEEAAAGFFAAGATLSFANTNARVAAMGDLATSRGTYAWSLETADGVMRDEGSYIEVWQKVDGEWKIVEDIYNSDVPPE